MSSFSEFDNHQTHDGYGDSVFTKMIKAGHRTYFIDVKTTRSHDYFMVLTELRKKITASGTITERNKVFIYQEDITKFADGLEEVLTYLRKHVDLSPKNLDE